MEELVDAKTLAIILALFGCASEIIGMLKIKSNSNVQLALNIFKRLFNFK